MKLLTQEEHLDEKLVKFPKEKNIIEKVRSGEIRRTDDIINDNGMAFLFLGPCGQCDKYKKQYITINVIDDYCRNIEGLMCEECVKKAMNLISAK